MTTPQRPEERSVVSHLQAIWMTVLNVRGVQEHDNFLELGGDSIAASTCLNRIRTALGVDVPIAALLMEDADFGTLVEDVEKLFAVAASSAHL